MSFIFIGHKTTVSPDFKEFVTEPKAPKNYKDPQKISDYIEEAKTEIRNTSSFKPFTSIVEEVSVRVEDENGKVVNLKTYKGVADFPEFIRHLDVTIGINEAKAFTFQAYTFMRIVSMQAIRAGIKSTTVPMWLTDCNQFRDLVTDLPKIFLPSSEEVSRIGYMNMFKYFGISLTASDMDDTVIQCEKLSALYHLADRLGECTPDSRSFSENEI